MMTVMITITSSVQPTKKAYIELNKQVWFGIPENSDFAIQQEALL
jgi:hypothetical protein